MPTITSSGQQVETYEVEDASISDATTLAADHEAVELITSLGLKGQEKLIDAGTVTRLPYRAMEAREALVYGTLFDGRTKVEDYSAEAIPLRVLQVIAHARECGMFDSLIVWHPKTFQVSDPLLLGIKKELLYPNHENVSYRALSKDVYFMLARWGSALLPLEQLEAMAIDLNRKARTIKLTKIASQVKRALEETSDSIDLAVLGKDISVYGLD